MILEKWDDEAKEVVRKFSSKERERLDAIISMHVLVCAMNDETAYMSWIYLVPDCPTEWDFIDFAQNSEGTEENESFAEAVKLFKVLWKKYADKENGLYIAEKTY